MLVRLLESLTVELVSVSNTLGGPANYTMVAFNQTYDLTLFNTIYEGIASGTSL